MPDFDNTLPEQTIEITASLAEGETTVFTYTDWTGMRADGLIIRYNGQLHAYRNVCPHRPLPLDYGDGEFLDDECRYLLCRNHAALFEPESGLCVDGPCTGASLKKFPVSEVNGTITITIPEEVIELE